MLISLELQYIYDHDFSVYKSYDKGLLGDTWFETLIWKPDRKFCSEIANIVENQDFYEGVKIWNFWNFVFS